MADDNRMPSKVEIPEGMQPVGEQIELIQLHQDPLKNKDRITAILTFHHEHQGYRPVTAECRYSGFLETFDIEPFTRRLKLTEDWTPLKTGDIPWIDVGSFVVENHAGLNLATIPTSEELVEISKKKIHISRPSVPDSIIIEIDPGDWQRIKLHNMQDIEIRCTSGTCPGYLWVFPK